MNGCSRGTDIVLVMSRRVIQVTVARAVIKKAFQLLRSGRFTRRLAVQRVSPKNPRSRRRA